MRKGVITAACLCGLVLMGAAFMGAADCFQAGKQTPAAGEKTPPEYVFTYAENQPEDYPTTQGARKFADLVYERTGGRIKINVFPGGELGDEVSVIQQLQYGGIDFARISAMTMGETVDEINVLQLPYLYRDADHMWKVLDGEIGEHFKKSLDGYGMVGLSWYDAGARHFYNSRGPITRIEDMRGKRIRVAESELMEAMISALGAKPVPMAYSEVYAALETGLIDGAENNWPSYESMGHYEVAPYITLDAHNRIPEMQLASQATWEKLEENDREIIRKCAGESAIYERGLWKEREAAAAKRLTAAGCIVTELNDDERLRFRVSMMTLYQTFCSDYFDVVNAIAQVR